MKLSPNTAPAEPDDLLIRMHNQVGAAIDVTGSEHHSRWTCHGCGYRSMSDLLGSSRTNANSHAAYCRGAYHRLR
ncbi:hypothetical protein [Streptomyces erythrochromogenes]|uniref:hypothetical protein n=1 Tax=Streptomyces erythrochromogenes TaxID=285574 RepID=UPI0022516683|nr:hypothetical protein [Streptomyces erythrochromogenes]MCX5582098.1 hypothetical protein [Streptomyces erythrochromogenes]